MKALLANILMTVDLISCRLIKTFVTVLLFIVGFVLAGMTLLCVDISKYDRIEYGKRCDIARTGCMYNGDMPDENGEEITVDTSGITDYEEKLDLLLRQQPYQRFYNQLKQSGLVEKCAQYVAFAASEVDKDIVKIQEKNRAQEYLESGSVEYINVQKDLFDLYDIKVETKVDRKDWCEGGIILGSQFKEKYHDAEEIYFQGKQCKLLGFLEKGQQLAFEDIAHEEDITLTSLHNLDYAFMRLFPEDAYTGTEIHFRLAEGVTKEEFRKKAAEMAKAEFATVESMYFIDEHLDRMEKSNMDVLGNIKEYAVALLAGVALICVLVKVYSILGKKRLYGIFYSSGLSTNQINALFVIENMILLLFSLLVAFLCLYQGLNYFCAMIGTQELSLVIDVVRSVLVSKVFVQEFLICCAMIIVTSGIPMLIFSRLSPLSMMRDFYE